MPRKKRNFIDKNKSVTFKLVGRSQDDPLFVDETAPQYVLVEKRSKQTIPIELDEDEQGPKNKKLSTAARREEQSKFGIYFDDDYNYLQHLIDAKDVPTLAGVEIQHKEDFDLKEPNLGEEGCEYPELSMPSTSQQLPAQPQSFKKLMLPSSVFDSTVREKEDLTKRAALPVGPQLDWDPDIVEAMDDDFMYDDPNNQIDDDFVMQAMVEKSAGKNKQNDEEEDDSYLYDFSYKNIAKLPKTIKEEDDEEDDDHDESYDEDDDLSVCGAASSDGDDADDEYYEAQDEFPMDSGKMRELLKKKNFKQYFGMGDLDDEDDGMTAKSASTHFTEYSMSSSVLPRNDQLKLLDEKFEQMFIREYADENVIGALDGDEELEESGTIDPNQSQMVAQLAEEYLQAKQAHFGMEYERNIEAVDFVRAHMKKLEKKDQQNESEEEEDSSTDTEYEEIEIEDTGRKGDKERFDCESVLSTYSNTNYHPRVLRDTDRYGNILLGRKSKSSHIRFDPRTGMPIGTMADKRDPAALTAANLARLDQATVRTSMSRLSELSLRPKNETPEERRERKKELKDFRAQRRLEKKANKLAFAEEKARIHKTGLNNAVQKKVAVI